ncbi:MAG: DUF4303 domain-containing protein, partial [Planctomycetaceae bacterium]
AAANTESHLAERLAEDEELSDGQRNLYKWYYAEWDAADMALETESLTELLGDAGFDDDEELQAARQAAWLWAMTEGLRLAREQGALTWNGKPVAAFCTMTDSGDAIWLERVTARHVNPPALFSTIEPELESAVQEWYGTSEIEPTPLQLAFEQLRSE